MQCVVYKSTRKFATYLYVKRDEDLARVPAALLQALGRLEQVMVLELSPARRLAQADAAEVRRHLRERGYYLQMPAEPSRRTP